MKVQWIVSFHLRPDLPLSDIKMEKTNLGNKKNQEYKPERNADGTLKKGFSGNPSGRPRDTMKDFLRRKLIDMTDEEKENFLKKISHEELFRMAEGHPHQTTDVTSGGKPIPIIAGITQKDNVVLDNDGDKKDQSVAPENQSGARGDGSVEDSINSLIAD